MGPGALEIFLTSSIRTLNQSSSVSRSVGIPDPYPMTPPNIDEVPDCWYVVNRGSEVGIFANGYVSHCPHSLNASKACAGDVLSSPWLVSSAAT